MLRVRDYIFVTPIFFILLSAACSPKLITRPPNPGNPIRSIAILPMVNNSDDVEAPDRVRAAFFDRIKNFHYDVKALDETNRILNEQMGITLGKQLDLTNPKQLGETLGVDGVFYGYLLNFDEVTIGIANTYKVRMGWKLVDAKTGQIIWGRGVAVMRAQSVGGVAGMGSLEAEQVGALPGSADPMAEMPGLDRWIMMERKAVSAKEGMVLGLGGKLLDGLTGKSLQKEMDYAYQRLFSSMIAGPGGTAIPVSQ